MKYLFIYYTGTYNTRFLTGKVAKTLLAKGDSCDTVEICADAKVIDAGKYDMVGLGYPIYGFNSPLPFNQYLKKVKFRKGQKFFIYKNSGETMELNNASSRIPLKIMKQKQCEFAGEYHFLMPYNIHFPFSKELICEMLRQDKKLLEIMNYNLKNGIVSHIKSNFMLDAGAFVMSVQKVGGDFNSFFYKVDSTKCILCRKCTEICPEKNIQVKNGKIVFGHNCDMCMRCSYFCPQHAISIGMLENWKVTDYYDLESLWDDKMTEKPFKIADSTPFAKYYKLTFAEIDRRYSEYLRLQRANKKENPKININI